MNTDELWLDKEIAEFLQKEGAGDSGLSACGGGVRPASGTDLSFDQPSGPTRLCGSHDPSRIDQYSRLGKRHSLDRYIAGALARSITHMARNSFFYTKKLAPYADVLRVIETFSASLSFATSPFSGTSFSPETSFSPRSGFSQTHSLLHDLNLSDSPGYLDFPLDSASPLDEILSLMEHLPFTTAADLAEHPQWFLSIGQSDVAGLVSVPTSGTTGERKRVFCSAADLERTVRFFRYGMRLLLPQRHNQKVLLLMSGERTGSVGHLLGEALKYWSIPCDIYGFPVNMAACLDHINTTRPSCMVGLPSHLMALCRKGLSKEARLALKAVLLSGEWASPTIRAVLEEEWQCPVFIHYGLTESGLAGAVECAARQGCHIREADIHFSIIDSHGRPLPDGEWGEIVLTTLSRQATPLLRYKTGDWGRMLPGPCSCGSMLKRLEAGERLGQRIPLPDGRFLGFGDLDAVLYALPWLGNYMVIQRQRGGKNDCSGCALDSALQVAGRQDTEHQDTEHQDTEHQGTINQCTGHGEKAVDHVPPTFLELRLDCFEPFTFRHWEECAEALSAIAALQVVRSVDDVVRSDARLPVILTTVLNKENTDLVTASMNKLHPDKSRLDKSRLDKMQPGNVLRDKRVQDKTPQPETPQPETSQTDTPLRDGLDEFLSAQLHSHGGIADPTGPTGPSGPAAPSGSAPMDKRRIYGVRSS